MNELVPNTTIKDKKNQFSFCDLQTPTPLQQEFPFATEP